MGILFPGLERGTGHALECLPVIVGRPKLHQPVRLGIWKWSKQRRMKDAEHRGVCANSHCETQYRQSDESWRPAELTESGNNIQKHNCCLMKTTPRPLNTKPSRWETPSPDPQSSANRFPPGECRHRQSARLIPPDIFRAMMRRPGFPTPPVAFLPDWINCVSDTAIQADYRIRPSLTSGSPTGCLLKAARCGERAAPSRHGAAASNNQPGGSADGVVAFLESTQRGAFCQPAVRQATLSRPFRNGELSKLRIEETRCFDSDRFTPAAETAFRAGLSMRRGTGRRRLRRRRDGRS